MIISIDDVKVMRAVLDRTPTNLREDRAIANIFSVIDQPENTPASAYLEKFDAQFGIDKVRDIARAFGYGRESLAQRFTVNELLQIRRMWLASSWDILPDRWEERQIQEALAGKPPRWDRNERPVYE